MLRAIYVVLLRLHPRYFREQFADEMLWIFDQAANTGRTVVLLGDAVRSLATQWMLRGDFDEPAMAGPGSDRVPVFYTAGSDMPPPGALFNGVIGSAALFAVASFALAHSGGGARVFTYYGSDFHTGPPVYGKPSGPPVYGQSPGDPVSPTGRARSNTVLESGPLTGPPVGPSKQQQAIHYFNSIPILATLDTNHDGELSAEEIANAPVVLLALDKNHDGKLDAEECGYRRPQVRAADGTRTFMSFDTATKTGVWFDMSKDGKLHLQEITPAMRLQYDRVIRRGRIDFIRLEPVLDALDTDRDTLISMSEVANAPAALRTLDRNHDGRLTLDEVQRDPVAFEVAKIFVLDANFDGKISHDERINAFGQRVSTLLDAADRNRNGYVTWEALAGEIRRRADLNHDGVVTWGELMKARVSGALGESSPVKSSPPIPKPEELR